MANGPNEPSISVGAGIPLKELGDLAFTTAKRGYSLANTGQAIYPVTTTDGGRTWRVDGPHLWVAAADAPATVESIGVAGDSTVFAYGGGQAIDTTPDGGQHWWSAYFDNFLAAASSSSSIWVLVNGPTPTGADHLSPVWLYASENGGRDWTFESALPNLDGSTAELVRATADTAFALVGKSANYVTTAGIAETTDGGSHWTTRSDPCNFDGAQARTYANQQLGATSADDLWLACGGVPGSESAPSDGQVKDVFRSTNAGRSWSSVAASDQVASPYAKANLSLVGAIADTGVTHQVAFDSTKSAWLVMQAAPTHYVRGPSGIWVGRNVLERTTDGGKNWVSPPSQVSEQYPQRIVVVGDETIVQTVNGLWTMSRGGKWSLLDGSASAA
jgi:hypothetical protein